jgi:hypothetical protein
VEALADRYDLDTRTIPPCWYRHNSIVETLSALHDFERISFDPNASPTGSMDFVRALRETEHRLVELSAKTQCSIHEHRTPPTQALVVDDEAWSAFVDGDTRRRWTVLTGEVTLGEGDDADCVPVDP